MTMPTIAPTESPLLAELLVAFVLVVDPLAPVASLGAFVAVVVVASVGGGVATDSGVVGAGVGKAGAASDGLGVTGVLYIHVGYGVGFDGDSIAAGCVGAGVGVLATSAPALDEEADDAVNGSSSSELRESPASRTRPSGASRRCGALCACSLLLTSCRPASCALF